MAGAHLQPRFCRKRVTSPPTKEEYTLRMRQRLRSGWASSPRQSTRLRGTEVRVEFGWHRVDKAEAEDIR